MPQALIVVFLLFFAVLAFAWFYLQRAKARTPAAESTDAASATPAMAASAPAADTTYAAPADDAHDHDDHDHEDHEDHTGHDHWLVHAGRLTRGAH